jgi:hypothetical protein
MQEPLAAVLDARFRDPARQEGVYVMEITAKYADQVYDGVMPGHHVVKGGGVMNVCVNKGAGWKNQ